MNLYPFLKKNSFRSCQLYLVINKHQLEILMKGSKCALQGTSRYHFQPSSSTNIIYQTNDCSLQVKGIVVNLREKESAS